MANRGSERRGIGGHEQDHADAARILHVAGLHIEGAGPGAGRPALHQGERAVQRAGGESAASEGIACAGCVHQVAVLAP